MDFTPATLSLRLGLCAGLVICLAACGSTESSGGGGGDGSSDSAFSGRGGGDTSPGQITWVDDRGTGIDDPIDDPTGGATCVTAADCAGLLEDGGPCKDIVCSEGECRYLDVPDVTQCEDDDPCTTQSACQGGVCVASEVVEGCCSEDADCDDGEPCTADDCEAGTCQHVFDYSPCDDGDACTSDDHCDGNGTCAGEALECDDESPCTVDSCDPEGGGCTYEATQDGTPCDDDNECTEGDACAFGVCFGDAACDCKDDSDCLAHEDGDLCNGTLMCNGFVCVVSPDTVVTCGTEDDTACTMARCEPETGACEMNPRPNGTGCEDGDPCTGGDACVAGSCVGQQPVPGCCTYDHQCSDGDPCTDDHCVGNACGYVPNLDPCDDGDPCTTMDHCTPSGSCAGLPVVCDDGDPCTADSCDTQSGGCTTQSAPAGTACDDGNPCTAPDTCTDGACGATSSTCECQSHGDCASHEDGNKCNGTLKCVANQCVVDPLTVVTCNTAADTVCTATACDKATGQCAPTPAADGLGCDDKNLCTDADVCSGGLCAGVAVVCDDGNPCTFDTCSPVDGCKSTPTAQACDDGDACTIDDKCTGGACTGSPLSCDDDNPCTTDSCSFLQGCTHVDNGNPCDDGNSCTLGDHCTAGGCVSGTNTCECQTDDDCAPLEDGDLCNGTLTCVANECVVDPATGVTCDTSGDTTCLKTFCSAATGQCAPKAVYNGAFCNDEDACTWDDRCSDGTCAGKPKDCDDDNPCTADGCDSASGCTSAPNAASCDDGNACTVGDVCAGGACVGGSPAVCEDDTSCTWESCDPAVGCVVELAPDGWKCGDGNACTVLDACVEGQCLGVPASCDDGNACTMDTCSNAVGCDHTSVTDGTPCDDQSSCTFGDACEAGVCGGQPVVCEDDDPCTADSCLDDKGCDYPPAPAGTPCEDGEACTGDDQCDDGQCVAGAFVCQCQTDSDCEAEEDDDLCNGTLYCDQATFTCKVEPTTVVACEPPGDPCLENVCDPAVGECVLDDLTGLVPGCEEPEPCVPECVAEQCSEDGCGAPCSECPVGQSCGADGACGACVGDCTGKVCGDDGCIGSCGICPPGTACVNGLSCAGACALCPGGGCDAFGFEQGLGGWDISGDTKVVSSFGAATPPEGALMLRLSTGLEYAAPSYAQRSLCASQGVDTLTFAWRFLSEEIPKWCWSLYQDYFLVRIIIDGTSHELMVVEIDDMCGEATEGLFDGMAATAWKTAILDLPAGADAGTLVFEVADIGDSILDTVVLIDQVTLTDE